jgi:hypothetical protein
LDLPRKRGLRDVYPLRGATVMLLFGYRHKVPQVP